MGLFSKVDLSFYNEAKVDLVLVKTFLFIM